MLEYITCAALAAASRRIRSSPRIISRAIIDCGLDLLIYICQHDLITKTNTPTYTSRTGVVNRPVREGKIECEPPARLRSGSKLMMISPKSPFGTSECWTVSSWVCRILLEALICRSAWKMHKWVSWSRAPLGGQVLTSAWRCEPVSRLTGKLRGQAMVRSCAGIGARQRCECCTKYIYKGQST